MCGGVNFFIFFIFTPESDSDWIWACFCLFYRMEYLTAKMSRVNGVEKEELQNQISLLEEDIVKIR